MSLSSLPLPLDPLSGGPQVIRQSPSQSPPRFDLRWANASWVRLCSIFVRLRCVLRGRDFERVYYTHTHSYTRVVQDSIGFMSVPISEPPTALCATVDLTPAFCGVKIIASPPCPFECSLSVWWQSFITIIIIVIVLQSTLVKEMDRKGHEIVPDERFTFSVEREKLRAASLICASIDRHTAMMMMMVHVKRWLVTFVFFCS